MKIHTQKTELAVAHSCMNSLELAKAAGLPPQTLNSALRDNNVRPATLERIAQALGVDPVEIVVTSEEK